MDIVKLLHEAGGISSLYGVISLVVIALLYILYKQLNQQSNSYKQNLEGIVETYKQQVTMLEQNHNKEIKRLLDSNNKLQQQSEREIRRLIDNQHTVINNLIANHNKAMSDFSLACQQQTKMLEGKIKQYEKQLEETRKDRKDWIEKFSKLVEDYKGISNQTKDNYKSLTTEITKLNKQIENLKSKNESN